MTLLLQQVGDEELFFGHSLKYEPGQRSNLSVRCVASWSSISIPLGPGLLRAERCKASQGRFYRRLLNEPPDQHLRPPCLNSSTNAASTSASSSSISREHSAMAHSTVMRPSSSKGFAGSWWCCQPISLQRVGQFESCSVSVVFRFSHCPAMLCSARQQRNAILTGINRAAHDCLCR
jgi:hypothetical protein